MIKKILSDKIYVGRAIKKHFDSLINDNSKKHEFSDLFTFFGIPFVVSVAFLWNDVLHSANMVSAIITIFSIFVGLLMNVLLLAFDLVNKNKGDTIKSDVLRELTANITYCILVSLLSIGLCLATQTQICFVNIVSNALLYFFEANFILTLLMIVKRTYLLFQVEAKAG